MRTLKNQTIYQCDYCGKRLLTKKGARLHEGDYCWHDDSPHKKSIVEKQSKCKHPEKSLIMQYRTMPGESHLLEPDYEECFLCGAKL